MTSPYTDQFILSVDRELTTDLGLSFIYVNKRGRDFAAWRDLTGVYEEVPYVDSVGAERVGRDDHRLPARERRRGSRRS